MTNLQSSFETTPTYANLFGTIQRAYDTRGGWTSDFIGPARRLDFFAPMAAS